MRRVPATLELTPLGTGAAYGLPDQAQSGYLVRAGDTLCNFNKSSTLNSRFGWIATG